MVKANIYYNCECGNFILKVIDFPDSLRCDSCDIEIPSEDYDYEMFKMSKDTKSDEDNLIFDVFWDCPKCDWTNDDKYLAHIQLDRNQTCNNCNKQTKISLAGLGFEEAVVEDRVKDSGDRENKHWWKNGKTITILLLIIAILIVRKLKGG